MTQATPSLPHTHLYTHTHTQGRELVTDTERGYFRLHVNQYSKVQTITVLSKQVGSKFEHPPSRVYCELNAPFLPHQPFPATNYLCLYNMHEKYLNNLLVRYDEKLIPDFFRYYVLGNCSRASTHAYRFRVY